MQRITIDLSQINSQQIALTSAQHHYLTRVIRLRTGERFQAIDGTGNCYLVELQAKVAQIIQVMTTLKRELPRAIILICALPKGNNFDDLVRACTELGVTTILPAISDRTLLNPSPQKLLRWQKIAAEAAEQSERLIVPTIEAPQALKNIFAATPDQADKYLCEARGNQPNLLTCLQASQLIDRPIIIAIGPEGGWTDDEIQLAIEHGFQLVALGARILRTITAPIVALSIVAAAIDNSEPSAIFD